MFGLWSPRRRYQAGLGIEKVSEVWSRDREHIAPTSSCNIIMAERFRSPRSGSARASADVARRAAVFPVLADTFICLLISARFSWVNRRMPLN
jgi:hypothetical protein